MHDEDHDDDSWSDDDRGPRHRSRPPARRYDAPPRPRYDDRYVVSEFDPRGARRSRVAAWFWSAPNAGGLAGVLLVLLLHLTVGLGWLVLPTALAAYVVGVLVTPRHVPGEVVVDADGPDADVRAQLRRLLRQSEQRLPADLHALVASICHSIELVLERSDGVPPGDPGLYAVRQTVLSYLPDALNAYLALPPGFAHRHRIDGTRTPDQVLGDQLALLDRQMFEVVESLAQHDASRLLASGHFLQARFGQPGATVDLPPSDEPGAGRDGISPTS